MESTQAEPDRSGHFFVTANTGTIGMINTKTNGAITVVYMGDSITEGQYVHHSVRWTTVVTASLRKRFESSCSDLHFFFNRGVSGETTRQGLERFPRDVQNARPDVVTLQFGLNDCNCWDTDNGLPRVSELAYRANLIEMIERASRFGTRHIIFSTNHPTLRHKILACGESLETRRKRYNDIVREVASTTKTTLCDIENAFNHFSETELQDMLLSEPDVLHLSARGHRYYAQTILPFLESAMNDVIHRAEDTT
jgi:lysophospholipase L1-like esterase